MNHTDLYREAAERLVAELPDPVPMRIVAKKLNVSQVTAYASAHRFLAAKASGDIEGMRNAIPCIRLGTNRIIVPRHAFVVWYLTAGLHDVFGAVFGGGGEAA